MESREFLFECINHYEKEILIKQNKINKKQQQINRALEAINNINFTNNDLSLIYRAISRNYDDINYLQSDVDYNLKFINETYLKIADAKTEIEIQEIKQNEIIKNEQETNESLIELKNKFNGVITNINEVSILNSKKLILIKVIYNQDENIFEYYELKEHGGYKYLKVKRQNTLEKYIINFINNKA